MSTAGQTGDSAQARTHVSETNKIILNQHKISVTNLYISGKACLATPATDGILSPAYCKFPFIYQGKSYNKCTRADVTEGTWCSTETDSFGLYVGSKWGWCVEDLCDVEEPKITTTSSTTTTTTEVNENGYEYGDAYGYAYEYDEDEDNE